MTISSPPKGRLEFIEGLKGFGALQVVLLHHISAFFPVMARYDGTPHYEWESWIAASPFFVLYNGFAAYNLFFLMSGFVLAPSFAKITSGWVSQAARRFLRLFLPMAVAFIFSVILLLSLPHAKEQANAIANSGWLAGSENSPMTVPVLAKDMFLNSMVFGYGEKSWWSSFDFMHPYLSSWSQSINGPFWTLHIILWGSLLLLVVAWLRQHLPRALFPFVIIALFAITGTGGFSLFLVGYLLYDFYLYLQQRTIRGIGAAGVASLFIGLALIDSWHFDALMPIFNFQNSISAGPTLYSEWINELGAIFVFTSALMCAPIAKFFSAKPFLALGRISFSLYLTHFPILFTVTCLTFSYTAQWGYGVGFLIAAAIGISLSLVVANLFERRVDVPCIALTKYLLPAQTKVKSYAS